MTNPFNQQKKVNQPTAHFSDRCLLFIGPVQYLGFWDPSNIKMQILVVINDHNFVEETVTFLSESASSSSARAHACVDNSQLQ